MKILVVEDDPTSQAILLKILSHQPEHQVTCAVDGLEAWHLLDDPNRNFDLVFLDLGLPTLDGFELLRRIRQAPLLKSLEVVVFTAANDRLSVVKALQLGTRHYLTKPSNEALVLAKLAQLQPQESTSRSRTFGGS